MNLTPKQLQRCSELLEIIVRPGDHNFQDAIIEAQQLFGYPTPKSKAKRAFYGIHTTINHVKIH